MVHLDVGIKFDLPHIVFTLPSTATISSKTTLLAISDALPMFRLG
jgi:hypothetical protein